MDIVLIGNEFVRSQALEEVISTVIHDSAFVVEYYAKDNILLVICRIEDSYSITIYNIKRTIVSLLTININEGSKPSCVNIITSPRLKIVIPLDNERIIVIISDSNEGLKTWLSRKMGGYIIESITQSANEYICISGGMYSTLLIDFENELVKLNRISPTEAKCIISIDGIIAAINSQGIISVDGIYSDTLESLKGLKFRKLDIIDSRILCIAGLTEFGNMYLISFEDESMIKFISPNIHDFHFYDNSKILMTSYSDDLYLLEVGMVAGKIDYRLELISRFANLERRIMLPKTSGVVQL